MPDSITAAGSTLAAIGPGRPVPMSRDRFTLPRWQSGTEAYLSRKLMLKRSPPHQRPSMLLPLSACGPRHSQTSMNGRSGRRGPEEARTPEPLLVCFSIACLADHIHIVHIEPSTLMIKGPPGHDNGFAVGVSIARQGAGTTARAAWRVQLTAAHQPQLLQLLPLNDTSFSPFKT